MRFIGYFGKGAIVTDDYTVDEVTSGLHLANFREDLRRHKIPYLTVYDENMRFVARVRA